MNASLRSKLRVQFQFANSLTREFQTDTNTRVVKVIDSLMFVDVWHGCVHIGTSVYDKANLDILTLKKANGKERFTVTDAENSEWKRKTIYYQAEMKQLEDSYTGGSIYSFTNAVRNRREEANTEKWRQKANAVFADMQPLTSEIRAEFERSLLKDFEVFVYDAKTKLGTCSRCKGTAKIIPHTRHKAIGKCPICDSKVTFYTKGKLAWQYQAETEIMWLSPLGDNLLLRYFTVHGRRDKEDMLKPVINVYEIARQIIQVKRLVHTYKVINGAWRQVDLGNYHSSFYSMVKLWIDNWGGEGMIYYNASEIKSFLVNSEFKYSGLLEWLEWKPCSTYAVTTYLLTWFKLPQIEWVVKSGFKQIADDIVYRKGYYNHFVFKPDAKNLLDWLHLDRTLRKEILPVKETISLASVHDKFVYPRQDISELIEVRETYNCSTQNIGEILDVTTLHKAIRYLSENEFKCDMWLDYIRMRKAKGNFDKKNSMIVFPRYLRKAHDEMLGWKHNHEKEVEKAKHAEMFKRLHEVALKVTKQFQFQNSKYLMTVPQTGDEIIQEGEEQHICVGRFDQNYMKNMASGVGLVLFVREKEAPDKSFFTVEVRDGKVLQVRGKYNSAPSDDVKKFILEFAQAKQLVCRY